jgi:hypothetical protein
MRIELEGDAIVRSFDPYAEAKRMHPSSLPPVEDGEHDGRGAVVLAFPGPRRRSA